MERFKKFGSRVRKSFGTIVNNVIVTVNRRRGSVFTEDLQELDQLSSDDWTIIYTYLSPTDILNLRLTNKRFKEQVDSLRGVRLKIDILKCWDQYKLGSRTGVEFIEISSFTPMQKNEMFTLKYPSLLKEVQIKGPVCSKILKYFLETCTDLERLELDLKSNSLRSHRALFANGDLQIPKQLKELKIIYIISELLESSEDLLSLRLLLSRTKCPEMKSFSLEFTDLSTSDGVDLLHLAALNFIQEHALSLKKVNVKILHNDLKDVMNLRPLRQLTSQTEVEEDIEEVEEDGDNNDSDQNDNSIENLELTEMNLTIDCYHDEWSLLLADQTSLKNILLNLEGFNWTEQILPIILKNCDKLRVLSLLNISLQSFDLTPLQDCKTLEELTLRHNEEFQFISQYFPPTLEHTEELPISLKEININNFVLNYHQELLLLMNLPHLERLQLGYWTESEETSLADFFGTLGSLISQEVTKIKFFVLKGLKTQFVNVKDEIDKLVGTLEGIASVRRDDLNEYDEGWVIIQVNQEDD